MNMSKKIKEEYWEEVDKISREVPIVTSRVHKFGYKMRQGSSFITITDFGNIWSWFSSKLSSALKEERKELREKIRGMKGKSIVIGDKVFTHPVRERAISDILKLLK